MGVKVLVGGKDISQYVTGYSVDEESTPVDISDTSGASSRFSLNFVRQAAIEVKRMRRKIVDLEDAGQGTTQGVARVPSFQNGALTLAVDSRTTLLVAERQWQPYVGTFDGYLVYLMSLVGIVSGYVIEDSLMARPVVYQGGFGDIWLEMKRALTVQHAEVALVSDNIVFRSVRQRTTVDYRDSSYSWSLDETGLALNIEGYVYPNTARSNALAYPEGGWNEDVQVQQVEAGQWIEVDVPLNASLSSVSQPVAQDFVGRYDQSASVYCVTGNDGLPIMAQQWLDNGGSIKVEIGEDTKSLIIKIRGADMEDLSPFTISATAGPSDRYSSLRIVGTGVFYGEPELHRFPTAVSPDLATQEVGYTINDIHVTTLEQLYDLAMWPLKRYGGARQKLSVTTKGINRVGESGSYAYPTVGEFREYSTEQGWATVGQLKAAYAGRTVGDLTADQLATVATAFVNQAFGNVAGARRLGDDLWWRIRSARYTNSSVSYEAEDDTVVGDLAEVWPAATIADFKKQHAGLTVGDFSVAPLHRNKKVIVGLGLYPGATTYPGMSTYPQEVEIDPVDPTDPVGFGLGTFGTGTYGR